MQLPFYLANNELNLNQLDYKIQYDVPFAFEFKLFLICHFASRLCCPWRRLKLPEHCCFAALSGGSGMECAKQQAWAPENPDGFGKTLNTFRSSNSCELNSKLLFSSTAKSWPEKSCHILGMYQGYTTDMLSWTYHICTKSSPGHAVT